MASQKHTTPAIQLNFLFPNEETWRSIFGFEAFYEVSTLGRVRSLDRLVIRGRTGSHVQKGRVLRQMERGRYLFVVLTDREIRKTCNVHVLVAEAFLGPRPHGLICHHVDGNPHNNAADNLAWVTYRYNAKDAVDRGTMSPPTPLHGEQQPNAKWTEAEVLEIRKMRDDGATYKELMQRFGMPGSTIWSILMRQTWKYLP